jgi:hypothetical protein
MGAVLFVPVPSSEEANAINLSKLDFLILPYAFGDQSGSVDFLFEIQIVGNLLYPKQERDVATTKVLFNFIKMPEYYCPKKLF